MHVINASTDFRVRSKQDGLCHYRLDRISWARTEIVMHVRSQPPASVGDILWAESPNPFDIHVDFHENFTVHEQHLV